jgi:plastocyanin
MTDTILHDHNDDGVDRRGFLKCMAWVNADDVPHKIVSSDGKFAASPGIDTNDQYAFRFTQPGRYEYFCALHPKMTGVIVVQ